MKRIVILGSTGSIGTQSLDIIRQHPDKFKVVGLTAHLRSEELLKQVEEFKPEFVSIADHSFKSNAKNVSLKEIASVDCDLLINALVGSSGLIPTLEAIKNGTTIGLANKETLVLAGEIVMREAEKYGATIIPIDSEHSALFQSLKSGRQAEIKNLILTMGKGKIAEMNPEELEKVSMQDIFSRPAWNMGNKVTIDSATCMNKSFEIIEAKWLFNVLPSQIQVIVHPDYICHSLVEFQDGSIITELGTADMRRYTQYALFYPMRPESKFSAFTDLYGKTLRFEKPQFEKFPCLKMGHTVLEMGGIMPAVLHGADHAAVKAFMENKIGFMDIPRVIEETLAKTENILNLDIEQLIEAEKQAQKVAEEIIGFFQNSASSISCCGLRPREFCSSSVAMAMDSSQNPRSRGLASECHVVEFRKKPIMRSLVITAAGNSTRFGENKLLLELGGKPIIYRTVEQFAKCSEIDEIIVATRLQDIPYYQELLKEFNVKVVEGGTERIESLYNGVIAASGDIIITHDGARPLTPLWLIQNLIKAVDAHGAAMTAVPPTATIKHADEDLIIKNSLPRTSTWIAQTPQGFKRDILLKSLESATRDKYFVATDDSEIVAMQGFPVKIVPGDHVNMKVTVKSDLAIAAELFK